MPDCYQWHATRQQLKCRAASTLDKFPAAAELLRDLAELLEIRLKSVLIELSVYFKIQFWVKISSLILLTDKNLSSAN